MWLTPITDRTQLDVLSKTDKAFQLHTDWLRVETDIDYLATYLHNLAYTSLVVNKLDWTAADIPYIEEQLRILANIQLLCDNTEFTASVPETRHFLDYAGVNQVEACLQNIKQRVDTVEQGFKHFGTTFLGQEFAL